MMASEGIMGDVAKIPQPPAVHEPPAIPQPPAVHEPPAVPQPPVIQPPVPPQPPVMLIEPKLELHPKPHYITDTLDPVKDEPCQHEKQGETINMGGIKQSLLSPAYLHTNSTSHVWPFSAIAELIDNAYDPDVSASQLQIDVEEIDGQTCLTFLDNGNGMSPHALHKMLSFGFCDKDRYAITRHKPVGHYGNGFKSGSMRLGKDALVLTKYGHGKDCIVSIGMLSQTYLEEIKSETILVPTCSWSFTTHELIETPDSQPSLISITMYGLLKDSKAILKRITDSIKGSGTLILVYSLRTNKEGEKEFDFASDEFDIKIHEDETTTDSTMYARQDRLNTNPSTYFSLRSYCSILFLRPKMQIYVRSKKVKTVLIKKSLSKTCVDTYRPQGTDLERPQKITFGFTPETDNYGLMMYYRNRLIRSYVRVGYQTKPNNMGTGVIGVIECNYLTPTHNKQDFDYNKQYRSTMLALGQKMNDYWNEKCGELTPTQDTPIGEIVPDQLWVQCDNPKCLKWRKMSGDMTAEELPDKWYCNENPDPHYKSCEVAEEPEDTRNDEPYVKTFKRKQLKARSTESERVANIILERQKQAQLMSHQQQQMHAVVQQPPVLKVGSLVGNMMNNNNPQPSTPRDDDELSILPSTPSTPSRHTPSTPSRHTPSTPSRPTPSTPSTAGGYNSQQPITAQVVAQHRMQQMGASSKPNYQAPISTQPNSIRSNGNNGNNGVSKVDDDDDLVVTAITPAKENSKPGDKRGPLTPGLTPGKRNKTSTHLFVVDGPTTIEEMGFTSQEDQVLVSKLAKLHPKTRWNLLVSRTMQLRDIRKQVCALLQMLVPELDQVSLGVRNESVDGTKLVNLLEQVLAANQEDGGTEQTPEPS